jgi:predicted RNA-binding Zn ribbon-like protein
MRRLTSLPFEFPGGSACLDFTNTVSWQHDVPYDQERLHDISAVIDWSGLAGLLSNADARGLRAAAALHPRRTSRTFARLLALRHTLHRLLSAEARGIEPRAADVEAVRVIAGQGMATARMLRTTPGIHYTLSLREPDGPEWLLEAIAWDALRLLASPDLALLRTCANDTCGWLFLDRSRRHNRRWCDMRECGNRVKVRRYYERNRSAAADADGS